jgi:hypothetical protein
MKKQTILCLSTIELTPKLYLWIFSLIVLFLKCRSNPSWGFHPQTQSLWLTDIAPHHLAIAFFFLVAGHMYRSNFGIGHNIKDLLEANKLPSILFSFFAMGKKVPSVDFCYIILEFPSLRLVCERHS